MSRLGGFGIPGTGAAEATVEREIMWGGDDRRILALWQSSVIDGASRDAGSTPTTYLRRGLILGRVTSTSKEKQWDSSASDGSQNIAGVLDIDIKAVDFDGNNADRSVRRLVRGPVRAGQLLIKGSALVGHADEYLARQQMVAAGFVFDDDPFGYLAGQGGRVQTTTAGAVTVTASDNGTTFWANGADTTYTLPAIQPGLSYLFGMLTDNHLTVASNEGDNIIVGNDASADSVAFTTAGKQIGALIRVRSMYVNAVLKWVLDLPSPAFGTGFTGGLAYAIAT